MDAKTSGGGMMGSGDFFGAFLRAFEAPEVGCPFVLPGTRQVADAMGSGWFFALQLGRGVAVGEVEWTGSCDMEQEFAGDDGRVWLAVLFSGECNLMPVGDAEFCRVETGRCALLRASRALLQWRGGSTIRGLVYSLSDEAWASGTSAGKHHRSKSGKPRLLPHLAALQHPLGTRLAYLTERLASRPPLERQTHMERLAHYHEWLAEFFHRFDLRERGREISPETEARIREIAAYLTGHPGEDQSLSAIARRFHLNEFALKQGFRTVFGTTVFGYLRTVRLRMAEEMLKSGNDSVIDIAASVGFSNPSHFSKLFKEHSGHLPRAFRQIWRSKSPG